MKKVSAEWDLEESKDLTTWYTDQYYKQLDIEEGGGTLQQRHNEILLHTLSLWNDFHFLCPLIRDFNLTALENVDNETLELLLPQLLSAAKNTRDLELTRLLIDRVQNVRTGCIKLFWLLVVEVEREAGNHLRDPLNYEGHDYFFARTVQLFRRKLCKVNLCMEQTLVKQGNLVEKLVEISCTIRQSRKSISGKKKLITDIITESKDLLLFDPISLPIKGDVQTIGIVPEQCSVFQSQLNPLLLSFLTKSGGIIKCLFKSGDDLRQDSFMLQILKTACCILEHNGISAKDIVLYEVVSTGLVHGFVEFVPSECLDNLFQDPKGLGKILRNEDGSLDETKMSRFIDSTAHYTVITYLMCIGDRHLDNILITPEGKLFHIDYGFIGREPKPFAPAVKLCPEMIDIMGGKFSGYYASFMRRCLTTFLVLRKNSHILLDMFELMIDAGIPDINVTTLGKIKNRFALDMSDEDAVNLLTTRIEKGFENVLPKMMDNFHHTWKVVQSGAGSSAPKDDDQLDDWCYLE